MFVCKGELKAKIFQDDVHSVATDTAQGLTNLVAKNKQQHSNAPRWTEKKYDFFQFICLFPQNSSPAVTLEEKLDTI